MSIKVIVIVVMIAFLVAYFLNLISLAIMGFLVKKRRDKFEKKSSSFDSEMDKKQSMINKYFK